MAIDELETRFSPASSAEVVYHATVHDIPSGDRPRERLQQHGADALSTADLLAIILRTGTTRDNVMELSNKLLIKYGGLGGLMSAGFHELCNEYGLGTAKTAQLKASLEIGKRLSMLQQESKYQIKSADDAANLVRMELMYLDHEETKSPRNWTSPQSAAATKRSHCSFRSSVQSHLTVSI